MARKRRWLRTDEYADALGSLRKAADTARLVEKDVTEWKWLLIAVHSAMQGVFVLALSFGNGLLTLKSSHASAWLKAYRSGSPWPQKLDLDYFLELYTKTKKHVLSRAPSQPTFVIAPAHDRAMKKLNDLRNGFIHFGAQGWSIELAGLPTICLPCLDVAEYLGWHSDVVMWRSVTQSKRARQALNLLRRRLGRLEREYQA